MEMPVLMEVDPAGGTRFYSHELAKQCFLHLMRDRDKANALAQLKLQVVNPKVADSCLSQSMDDTGMKPWLPAEPPINTVGRDNLKLRHKPEWYSLCDDDEIIETSGEADNPHETMEKSVEANHSAKRLGKNRRRRGAAERKEASRTHETMQNSVDTSHLQELPVKTGEECNTKKDSSSDPKQAANRHRPTDHAPSPTPTNEANDEADRKDNRKAVCNTKEEADSKAVEAAAAERITILEAQSRFVEDDVCSTQDEAEYDMQATEYKIEEYKRIERDVRERLARNFLVYQQAKQFSKK